MPIGLDPLPPKLASFIAGEVTDPAPLPTQPIAHPSIVTTGPMHIDNGGSFDMLVYMGPMMRFAPLQKTGQLLSVQA